MITETWYPNRTNALWKNEGIRSLPLEFWLLHGTWRSLSMPLTFQGLPFSLLCRTLSFDVILFIYFPFVAWPFGVISKKSLPMPVSRILTLMFSSGSFMVSHLIFSSYVHSELTLRNGVRSDSSFFHMKNPAFKHH